MFIRAALLVLVALNLGVALWWLAQPDAPTGIVQPRDPEVPSLTLLTESVSYPAAANLPDGVPVSEPAAGASDADAVAVVTPDAPDSPDNEPSFTPTTAPEPTASAAPPIVVVPERCYRLGPFTSETAARAVRSELGGIGKRMQVREIVASAPIDGNRYRIIHPPLSSLEQAEAVARRISDAGFQDYFLITSGPQANAIALGIFRSREGAERQLKALQAAGFPVQLIPENESRTGPSQWWLDAEIADIGATRTTARISARQVQTLACDGLR
ncbi:MAG: hypothetical protein LBL59_03100 [Xanthomonadaceae bacterium]|jgi:hypothetical protein|nr:hypothetical protein [Xanthomonadaceae bacterium]